MATGQTVIDSARYATDQVGSSQVTDGQLLAFLNEDLPALYRRVANVAPDRYTKVITPLTVAATTLTSVPADFLKVRTLHRIVDATTWQTLPRMSVVRAMNASTRCYLVRGASTIEVFPASLAPGSYRLTYLYQPAIALVGTVLDLPEGFERVASQNLAVRIRLLVEEENLIPFHQQLASAFGLSQKRDSKTLTPIPSKAA